MNGLPERTNRWWPVSGKERVAIAMEEWKAFLGLEFGAGTGGALEGGGEGQTGGSGHAHEHGYVPGRPHHWHAAARAHSLQEEQPEPLLCAAAACAAALHK